MPRKLELTWQPGSEKRAGRWKKFFRGKSYYFDGGRGKSDRDAYRRAWDEWNKIKSELAQSSPKPHQSDYEDAIRQWNAVLRWSDEHGDITQAERARKKLKDLKSRFNKSNPSPLQADDDFFHQFKVTIPLNLDEILQLKPPPTDLSGPTVIDPSRFDDHMDGSPSRIAQELWKDRLAHYLEPKLESVKTIQGNVARFLEGKRSQIAVQELSVARFTALEAHLRDFSVYAGELKSVVTINGEVLTGYRSNLLYRVSQSEISLIYAKNRLDAAKQFVRWLWKMEAIDSLPRILDSPELRIGNPHFEVKTFAIAEIQRLYRAASDRSRLYICLALNCGMTQVDISDLKQSEVNWNEGTLTRKRSKTKKHKSVPKVQYRLWPETFRLLRQERSEDGERVLLNENQSPLRVELLREDGTLNKTDNVRNAFSRLLRKLKVKGRTFKALKKTSATLLRDHLPYQGLEDLFLGHAAQRMSEKHYTRGIYVIPHEAIEWLGAQYKLPITADSTEE